MRYRKYEVTIRGGGTMCYTTNEDALDEDVIEGFLASLGFCKNDVIRATVEEEE